MRGAGDELFEVLERIPAGQVARALEGVDADRLVWNLARHGLSAYVVRAMDAEGVTLAPRAQAQLVRDARGSIALTMKRRRSLNAVLDALAAAGITPVLLKGVGLAARIYGDPLVRPCSDVDVLVARDELDAVRRAVTGLGLTEQKDSSLGDVFDEHHHLSFSAKDTLVEVHFRLFSGFGRGAFDEAAASTGAARSEFDGRPVRYLAPDLEFLYLAVHAANHAFLRATWLVDLQRFLLLHPSLPWSAMAVTARRAGFSTAAATALDTLARALRAAPAEARAAFPLRRWRAPVTALAFSRDELVSGRLADGRVTSFAARLFLADGLRRGSRQLVDGAGRALRRALRGGGAS